MSTTLFVIAAVITLLCLAVPVSIWVRMYIDKPRMDALIRSRMQEVSAAFHADQADR